jgi:hypothetical protein
MGILREAAKLKPRFKRSSPAEVKRQIVLDELKAMNISVSRAGLPIEQLSYDDLKEEWVFASICSVDITSESNKWY